MVVARHALYQELFTSCHPDKKAAIRLADMHVAIAQAFVEVERPKRVCSKDPAGFQVVGMLALRCMMGFRGLWPRELRRYPSCAAGWSGITALELLWQFIFDTGMLLPFWYESKWCTVDGLELIYASCYAVALLGRVRLGRSVGFPCWEKTVWRVTLARPRVSRGWRWWVVEDLSSLFRRFFRFRH